MRRFTIIVLLLLPLLVWVATVPADIVLLRHVAEPTPEPAAEAVPSGIISEAPPAPAPETTRPVPPAAPATESAETSAGMPPTDAVASAAAPVSNDSTATGADPSEGPETSETVTPTETNEAAAVVASDMAEGVTPVPSIPPTAVTTAAPEALWVLVTEPLSAEWENRLVPPLLQTLNRLGPFATLRSSPSVALQAVAAGDHRLALVYRSSAQAADAEGLGLELLEVGPAACTALVVRPDAPWESYADLNYGRDRPLRAEAVSMGARNHFEQILREFPLAGEVALEVRPTHVAAQRLVARESDIMIIDAPRRGASGTPPEVIQFVQQQNLRLLPIPEALFSRHPTLGLGEVVVESGWLWQSPTVYTTVCDPFVLAMPRTNADHLIHGLYTALNDAGDPTSSGGPRNGNGATNGSHDDSLFGRLAEASRRLLSALGWK